MHTGVGIFFLPGVVNATYTKASAHVPDANLLVDLLKILVIQIIFNLAITYLHKYTYKQITLYLNTCIQMLPDCPYIEMH